jgi:hypothetical protein
MAKRWRAAGLLLPDAVCGQHFSWAWDFWSEVLVLQEYRGSYKSGCKRTGILEIMLCDVWHANFDHLTTFVMFLIFHDSVDLMRSWALTIATSTSGSTPLLAILIRNIWHGWRRWMTSGSPRVGVVEAISDGSKHRSQWIRMSPIICIRRHVK